MNEHGFVPFSAAGALIVILALVLVAQASLSGHQRSLWDIDDASSSSLLTKARTIHADLQSTARQSVYLALSEVGKRASEYTNTTRKAAIESLAADHFAERVTELASEYVEHDARIDLDIAETSPPFFEVSESEFGYVSTLASLPAGSRIRLTSWDEKTELAITFEKVYVFVDSRYFLLERSMDNFLRDLGNINSLWQTMEYTQTIAAGLLTGKVELNASRSKALFESAWALHELKTFGSSDYWRQAQRLLCIESAGAGFLADPMQSTSREKIYEIFPPVPIKSHPGLSVYHEIRIKSVSYKRQDLAGMLGLQTATPIPVVKTGTIIWWAQWEITVELCDNPVEEIFDFENPTLPIFFATSYVHKPLAYRWELSEKKFKTVVTAFNIKPFSVFVR